MELIILGHIIGDFYVQTDKIAEEKKNKIGYMLLHCLIYSIIVGVCFYVVSKNVLGTMAIALIVLLTHFVIDIIKRARDKKQTKSEYIIFMVDQAAHMITLYAIFYFSRIIFGEQTNDYFIINEINIRPYIMAVVAFLLCWKPAAIFISLVFKVIPKTVEQADEADEPAKDESKTKNEQVKIGSWIGILEREIILLLGLMGQYGAIGFVLTAKSVARFKQLENKSFAEKYLVGTLLSSFIAIACIVICIKGY